MNKAPAPRAGFLRSRLQAAGTRVTRQLHAVTDVLKGFSGNARTCVAVEPMWGIPYNLYITYASVYMLALGCSAEQIGLITSVSMALQTVFSLAGGVITDRLGRRRTTLLFDLISWSVPTLIWALAQDFWWFMAAGIVNSAVRVVANSWSCLMIEDSRPHERVHIFTWCSVAGIVAGFIAPVAGLLVKGFGMVPAMRGLYLFAFVSMTALNLIRNAKVKETRVGTAKMEESRGVRTRAALSEYRGILAHLRKSPLTILAFVISILLNIHMTIRTAFLSVLLVRGLGFAEATISLFPIATSIVMLIVYVFVMPTVSRRGTMRPLLAGLASFAAGSLLLTISPERSFLVVASSMALTALGGALAGPLSDTFVANSVVEKDRAKAMSIFHTALFAVSAPFGFLGGLAAGISDRLPFVIATAALVAATGCAVVAAAWEKKRVPAGA